MIIRELEKQDIEEISRIEAESFSMPWSARDFEEMIETDYAYYYVAILDGKPVGCVGMRNILGEGQITNVVVDKSYRNRKIARSILEYMMKKTSEIGVYSYTLEVRPSNSAAIHLYESLGFVSEGLRKNFYENPTEDAMIMWKR